MSEPDHGARSTAQIVTIEPSRIILRLCKHWGHKFNVSYDEEQGQIDLTDYGSCHMQQVPDGLAFTLHCPDASVLPRLQQVVAEHAQRMARNEHFDFHWVAA